jgi:hypothetical protein
VSVRRVDNWPEAPNPLMERKHEMWITSGAPWIGRRRDTSRDSADSAAPVGSSGAPSGSARPLDGLPSHVVEALRRPLTEARTLPGVTIIELEPGHVHTYDAQGRAIPEATRCPG